MPCPSVHVDQRGVDEHRALVVLEVEVAAVARGDRRRAQPHRLGQVQPEPLAAVQRHQAVGRGDERHLVRPAEPLVPEHDVGPALGRGDHLLVVHPALAGVHRLDHQHRPLAGANARWNARIAPIGFFRSVMLKWSKATRKTKRSAQSARARRSRPASAEGCGAGTGIGTQCTGTSATGERVGDEARAGPDLVDQRRRGAIGAGDRRQLPEPVADQPPVRANSSGWSLRSAGNWSAVTTASDVSKRSRWSVGCGAGQAAARRALVADGRRRHVAGAQSSRASAGRRRRGSTPGRGSRRG